MKDEYDRTIRQVTRSVHGKYKPEILKLENELKKLILLKNIKIKK